MILFAPNLGMYDACRFNVYPPSVLHTAPPLTAATRRHARTHNHTHVRANVLQHNLGTNPGRVACRAQARAVITGKYASPLVELSFSDRPCRIPPDSGAMPCR